MTDVNKSNNRNADIENQMNAAPANSQQLSVRAWSQKLLVVILCIASFYGGWKSYESNMVNDCKANGGQMIEGNRTLLCQLS